MARSSIEEYENDHMSREGGEKRNWDKWEKTTDSETAEPVEVAELQEAPPDTSGEQAERAAAAAKGFRAEVERQRGSEEK